MSDQARGLITKTINKFRGINQFTSVARSSPEFALDLLNVVVAKSGELRKMRVPLAVSTLVSADICYGMFDFQQGNGTRQIIAFYGDKVYKLQQDGAGVWQPTLIDTHINNAHRWSAILSNNVLYCANGVRMMKWTGVSWWVWGINKPQVAPTVDTDKTLAISGFQRAGNVETLQVDDTSVLVVGDGVTVAGLADASFNGARTVAVIVDGTHVSFNNLGVGVGFTLGAGTCTVNGPLTLTTGRSYRAAFKSSVSGHEGSGSAATASTGAVAAGGIVTVSIQDAGSLAILADDLQIDTVVWYATIDGGVEYLFHSEVPLGAGVPILHDRKTDAQLSALRRVCLINDPPPVGSYLAVHGGRVFIGNLDGSPQDIVYSGVEQVRNGRQEESFPPNNRLRLAIGADFIRGIGVVQSGVIAGSKSDELFMFRGEVEDIVSGEPIAYSAVLEELPYATGIGSHFTIAKTPYGLHFLSSNRTVDSYVGDANAPYTLSDVINNLMRDIPSDQMESCVGCYFNYLDKDWYIIGLPEPGSATQMSKVIVFDLGSTADDAAGVFIFNIGLFDALAVVENPSDGRSMVLVSQGGFIKELRTFTDEVNGIPQAEGDDDSGVEMGGYYVPGYMGNDSPEIVKFWRHATVESTRPVTIEVRLVDEDFTSPTIVSVPPEQQIKGKAGINRKSRRLSPAIIFDEIDVDCSVFTYRVGMIPLSDR